MVLVGYSDSEGSDSEPSKDAPALAKPAARLPKATALQKLADSSGPRKIKVDLPATEPEAPEVNEPPAKKARTGGFGGFNSFLPAPKRSGDAVAAKSKGLGSGVNLRTGAEPAFSRERAEPQTLPTLAFDEEPSDVATGQTAPAERPKEVKTVGNAMRFKPLSVANKKTPPKKKVSPMPSGGDVPPLSQPSHQAQASLPAKPKVSLFSVPQDGMTPSLSSGGGEYKPLLSDSTPAETEAQPEIVYSQAPANPNSLDAIANDLNLSASARRQLFGRNKDPAAAANIMHFNIDDEYKANEQLRAQGQAVEHRALKSVAPGKHSLQQLVSAANTQKDALEDAWAQGKRNKAEGGSRYGW